MQGPEVIIIGAGACGLMAARELAKKGQRVLILEVRDRVGGRIWPLSQEEFGYPAQGGAEFVHGPAPVTKALVQEASLTYVDMAGEMWDVRDGQPVKIEGGPDESPQFLPHKEYVQEKLKELKEDIPLADFLDKYFTDAKYADFRDWAIRMVEGFDAADPHRISTLTLGHEWLGEGEWQQGKIKEGYGPLLNFLVAECQKNGVTINFQKEVQAIELTDDGVRVRCSGGEEYDALKVIVTVALPILNQIKFTPALPEKMAAASKIGFGPAIKILMRFKDQWWAQALGVDLSKLTFLLCNGKFSAWWTQYPESTTTLTGWASGPKAVELKNTSAQDILELAFDSLANTFKVKKDFLAGQLVAWQVVNWPADPFALGAYSYSTTETQNAYKELVQPVANKIFFAGEALFSGEETATVEGALASGKEVVEKILNS